MFTIIFNWSYITFVYLEADLKSKLFNCCYCFLFIFSVVPFQKDFYQDFWPVMRPSYESLNKKSVECIVKISINNTYALHSWATIMCTAAYPSQLKNIISSCNCYCQEGSCTLVLIIWTRKALMRSTIMRSMMPCFCNRYILNILHSLAAQEQPMHP